MTLPTKEELDRLERELRHFPLARSTAYILIAGCREALRLKAQIASDERVQALTVENTRLAPVVGSLEKEVERLRAAFRKAEGRFRNLADYESSRENAEAAEHFHRWADDLAGKDHHL